MVPAGGTAPGIFGPGASESLIPHDFLGPSAKAEFDTERQERPAWSAWPGTVPTVRACGRMGRRFDEPSRVGPWARGRRSRYLGMRGCVRVRCSGSATPGHLGECTRPRPVHQGVAEGEGADARPGPWARACNPADASPELGAGKVIRRRRPTLTSCAYCFVVCSGRMWTTTRCSPACSHGYLSSPRYFLAILLMNV